MMAEYIYETARGERMGQSVDIRVWKKERVVRCRDCKFYRDRFCTLLEFTVSNADDGFCAWGKRELESGDR